MPFPKRFIIFDLDGTLTESKQPLSAEMARLLAELALQKKIIIISGCSFAQFEKQFFPAWNAAFKESDFEANENLTIMPASGMQCYEYDSRTKAWKMSYAETFPVPEKEMVMKVLNDIIDSHRFDVPEKHFGPYIEDRGSQITFSAFGQNAPLAVKKLWDPDQKKRQLIKQEIESRIQNVSVGIGGSTSVDVLPEGMDKAAAIKKLLKRMQLEPANAVFVGDALYPSGNDSSVILTGIETISVSRPEETAEAMKKWLELEVV